LKYNTDGTIIPVQQTLKSVDKVIINQPFEIQLLKKSLQLKANKLSLKFKNVNLGSGYYYFGLNASNVTKPTRAEIRLDSPKGKLVGTVLMFKNGVSECSLREANGKHNVYVVFNSAINVESMRFFAGNTK
jgi:hypothetical protein